MVLPKLYIILNAFFWGLVWIPLKYFNEHSLHPIHATFSLLSFASSHFSYFKKKFFFLFFFEKRLLIALSYGITNLAFNLGYCRGKCC